MTVAPMPSTKLANWFGANTGRASQVGELLGRVAQATVPFMGGGCELPHIQCREGIASDLHGAVVNLSRVIKSPETKAELLAMLESTVYHERVFRDAQAWCKYYSAKVGTGTDPQLAAAYPDIDWAYHYFIACWMAPGGSAGTAKHLDAYFSWRISEPGGGCAKRFRTAVEGIDAWHDVLARWVFLNTDALGILDRLADRNAKRVARLNAGKRIEPCGVYADPPWPGPGRGYEHAPKDADDERAFHADLEQRFRGLTTYRVVVRFGVHPLIDELYDGWHRIEQDSRNQANRKVPEVMLTNEPFRREVRP